jgi:hypothetical protein
LAAASEIRRLAFVMTAGETRHMRLTFAALALVLTAPTTALAWGAAGHRMLGEAAMQGLPADLPAFLRTPQAAADVGELSREPDRERGAARTVDNDHDAGHFLDLDDTGAVKGGPKVDALPVNRALYEKALAAVGTDSWKDGFLPYAIIDNEQLLARDFAFWRILSYAAAHETKPERKAWYVEDLRRREALIFGTIGQLSHFVGDGSQPLHVSVHFNGWGDYPNPNGYTAAHIHSPFEGAFVTANIKTPMIRAKLAPPVAFDGPADQQVGPYLAATFAQVEPLYALEKAGGFKDADPRGIAFATERLAAGASELRDMIVAAWTASLEPKANAGFPPVKVADVLSGAIDPYDAVHGKD